MNRIRFALPNYFSPTDAVTVLLHKFHETRLCFRVIKQNNAAVPLNILFHFFAKRPKIYNDDAIPFII